MQWKALLGFFVNMAALRLAGAWVLCPQCEPLPRWAHMFAFSTMRTVSIRSQQWQIIVSISVAEQ